jgi:ADP-ribosylglycohydrolase
MHSSDPIILARAQAALKLLYVADALSMPVHWFYNPLDILKAFPGGIKQFEAPPLKHPSSIMALHSTSAGGRGSQHNLTEPQVVGDIILKGKRQFWGIAQQHYHQGMKAGENTLNAHCARLAMRTLTANKSRYNATQFLDNYIAFMTSQRPLHPDTYAESYHRGFFAHYAQGIAADKCAAKTHDTPSVGGLVTIAPIAIAELLNERNLERVQRLCTQHLYLTHPDEKLAAICSAYVALIDNLLFRQEQDPADYIIACAQNSIGLNLRKLLQRNLSDNEVVGGIYSKACYIDDSWPSILFLLYKYLDNPEQALLANTNLGGENCHRGSLLGVLLGLATSEDCAKHFARLADAQAIDGEINALLGLKNTA